MAEPPPFSCAPLERIRQRKNLRYLESQMQLPASRAARPCYSTQGLPRPHPPSQLLFLRATEAVGGVFAGVAVASLLELLPVWREPPSTEGWAGRSARTGLAGTRTGKSEGAAGSRAGERSC